MNTRYSDDQHAMDYGDEIAYEAGTLMVNLPVPIERTVCPVDGHVFILGETVVYQPTDELVTIQRITWNKRISRDGRDWSYFQIDYETRDGCYGNASPTYFRPNTNGIVVWDIPC